jgi:predicted DCC family thiol-disulfide oxidoreductase YuxK
VIVLYDEDCGFCRWTLAWALERDRERALEIAPIQSETGTRLLADMDPAERLCAVHVVHADARRESGGAAVRDVLNALPSRNPLARVASIPLAYRFAAKNRSWLSRLVPARAKRRADARVADRLARS